MDTLNSNPEETQAAPAPAPAPAAESPKAVAAPAPAAAPAQAEPVKGKVHQTSGKTPGGWNRFAGYNPNAPKNKPKDRRESRGRR